MQDGNAYDLALAGLVEYNNGSATGFIAGLDQTTCLATIFYQLGSITTVLAVRVQRDTISSNSYYYLVGLDATNAEHIFKFDAVDKY